MRHTLTLLTTTLALMLTAIAVTGGKPAPAQNQNDWTEPFPAFRIAGNLYYVIVDTMRANGLNTVLCVGNGISQEPRALAWAGFDVTAVDLSPYATQVASELTPPAELLTQLIGGRSGGQNGNLKFVVGNLSDAECCPGPYDVVIERLTLQLYSDEYKPRALQAVANRLASPGIFFSQSHYGCWKPPAPRIHANEWWFRAQEWPIWPTEGPLMTRVAWLLTTTG